MASVLATVPLTFYHKSAHYNTDVIVMKSPETPLRSRVLTTHCCLTLTYTNDRISIRNARVLQFRFKNIGPKFQVLFLTGLTFT